MVGISLGNVVKDDLSQSNDLSLKHLLETKLKHPDCSDSIRGFEGMKIANEVLKERNSLEF